MTEQTRAVLVKAALRAIYNSSFESIGVAAITEQAGVPKGSFYHWFSSKEELAGAAIDAFADAGAQLRKELLADDGRPPIERLRAYFEHSILLLKKQKLKNGCMLGNLSLEMAGRSELLRMHLNAGFERWETALREVLIEAKFRGELSVDLDPSEVAAYLLNGWEGALLRMKATRSDLPLILFMRFVFDGLLKQK